MRAEFLITSSLSAYLWGVISAFHLTFLLHFLKPQNLFHDLIVSCTGVWIFRACSKVCHGMFLSLMKSPAQGHLFQTTKHLVLTLWSCSKKKKRAHVLTIVHILWPNNCISSICSREIIVDMPKGFILRLFITAIFTRENIVQGMLSLQ